MTNLQPPDHNASAFDLAIRFSASLPDLLISIPNSSYATTSTVKVEIRKHLPPDLAKNRIRLIHAGKALADDACLNTSLKRPLSRAPSPRPSTPLAEYASGKGKAVLRDPPLASRIYIHCSIGDVVLAPFDLAAEAALALPTPMSTTPTLNPNHASPTKMTTSTPRGFDRLLTAGFSASEVSSLRLQFRAVQQHTHTPDAMPSPTTLREMEDQWLDSSENLHSGTGVAGPEDAAGSLDDLLWGASCGFFWPVGCVLWAGREEGIWTRRRKMAVVMGVIVNVIVGMIRWMR